VAKKPVVRLLKPDVMALIQFQTYDPHIGSNFHRPEAFYLTKDQVFSVDHLFKLYEGLYNDYPGMKPFVLIQNPRFVDQDYTEKHKTIKGLRCLRLTQYMQRRGIEIPSEFFEKYGK
jgi:hypothetical protein